MRRADWLIVFVGPVAIIWLLWAPAAAYWAAQHAELAQQEFATVLMLAAVVAAASMTGYVYTAWAWPGMLNIARTVRDRPQHAASVACMTLGLGLALVYGEGWLSQQQLPCQPALLLSVLDFLQLLLVRRPLVRLSMNRAPHRDEGGSRPPSEAVPSKRPYRNPRVYSFGIAKRPSGRYGYVGLSPSAGPRAVLGVKGRISTCWVASVVVWLSTKVVLLLLVWAVHGEPPSTSPTAVQDPPSTSPMVHEVAVMPEVTHGSISMQAQMHTWRAADSGVASWQGKHGSVYLQMLQTHLWFAFAALCVSGLLSFLLPLSVLLFDAQSAQDLWEAAGDCVSWCRAAVARTAAAARSGLGCRLSFSRAQSLVLGGCTRFSHLLQLPVRDVVLSGASSLRAVVTRVCGWVVQNRTAAAAGVSRRAAAVRQSWQQRPSVFAARPGSRRDAPVAAAAAPDTSSSSGAQPPASACRAAAAVSDQSNDCIVCFEARRSVALLPCGHVALCKRCFAHVRQQAKAAGSVPCCPLCRTEVKQHVGGLVVV
jgi:hypothetical protein